MSRLSTGEAIQQVVAVLSQAEDTTEVLAAIARVARQMMLADEGYLLLREGGRLVLRASDGLPEGLMGHAFVRIGEGVEGWVAEHGEAVAISDVTQERRFRDLPGREGRVRAFAAVPMRLRDDVVGVLATTGTYPLPPAGSRLTGLEILASIGAVALENDRLLRQERRRAHQAELLLRLASIQALELWPFLQLVADEIGSSMSLDETQLVLFDDESKEIVCSSRPSSHRSPSQCEAHPASRLLESSWASELLSTGRPLLIEDAIGDPRFGSEFADSGMRSLLAVPILVRNERRGILRVASRQPATFRAEDLAFFTVIATQVGLSVERADLARRQREISHEEARQQARQDFLGLVSHELKTPVAVFKAYTELLLRKSEIEPQRASDQEVLSRMLEQSDRMLAMIEQLLDLQKLEAGHFPLELSLFDLSDLTHRVVESLQLAARSHRLVCESSGGVVVMADRRRMEEVLFNLVENAVKYSPMGSKVTVSVGTRNGRYEEGQEAFVSVADEGAGIPPRDLPHIFDRFYQGEGRFLRGHVGLGLGLYIAREIIERHGGRVWAESQPDRGAIFHVVLPLPSARDEE